MNKIALLCIVAAILVSTASAQSYLTGYCGKNGGGANIGIVYITAPWYCTQINTQAASIWAQWEPLAIAVVMASFSIATIIFMAGIVLKNDKIRTFGIGEMYESIASLIIVALFLFIAAVMFGLLPSAFFIGPVNPYQTSLGFMAKTINSTINVDQQLFITAMVAGYYGQLSVNIEPCASLSCSNIVGPFTYAIIYLFFWPAWAIHSFLLDAIISLYSQYYMILFFMYASIPVFLIPGVIFRSFMPTRSLGGKMMAIAIGFYFLMPTLYSIAYATSNVGISSQLAAASSALTKYGGGNVGALQNAISPASPLELLVAQGNGTITQTFSEYWLMILFYPSVIITITYFFIIQVAEIIGGMARSSSRLRGLM
jgi:hypothetical protein